MADNDSIVQQAGRLLTDRYVFPDIGKQCAQRLARRLSEGAFGSVSDPEGFARMLTEELYSVAHDKHRVRTRPRTASSVAVEDPFLRAYRQRQMARQDNFGFAKAEVLEGNVGILDIRWFQSRRPAPLLAGPSRIYLYDPGDGLVSMRFDGTDRRAHLKVTGFTVNARAAEPNTADEILIAPDSTRALALVNNYVYLVSLPQTGQQPLSLSVADPAAASFPARRLTRIGGDFIGWAADGRSVTWALGRSVFRYRMAAADSMAKLKASADSARADSLKALGPKPDSAFKARVDFSLPFLAEGR